MSMHCLPLEWFLPAKCKLTMHAFPSYRIDCFHGVELFSASESGCSLDSGFRIHLWILSRFGKTKQQTSIVFVAHGDCTRQWCMCPNLKGHSQHAPAVTAPAHAHRMCVHRRMNVTYAPTIPCISLTFFFCEWHVHLYSLYFLNYAPAHYNILPLCTKI